MMFKTYIGFGEIVVFFFTTMKSKKKCFTL